MHKKHLFFCVFNYISKLLKIRTCLVCLSVPLIVVLLTFMEVFYGDQIYSDFIYLFIFFLHFVNCLSCGTFTTLCHRNLKTFDFIFFFRFIICVSWDKISSKSKFHKTYFVFYKNKIENIYYIYFFSKFVY